jgi:glycosyltransferase involved in cell wall biosynthesis
MNRPLIHKILHLTKIVRIAGMEQHLLLLLPGLQACGLDIQLVVLVEADNPQTDYITEMRKRGVYAEQMVIQRHIDPALIGELARKLRDEHFDAIHTHLIHADLHGILAAKRAGLQRIFFSAHNDDRFRRLLPIRIMQGWLWRQVVAGITISHALRRFVIDVEFAPPSCVHTVHYGLDPAIVPIDTQARIRLCGELGIDPQSRIAGSVCRLTGQKGITHAIEAFKLVAEQRSDTHYVIAGEGPLRTELEAQVTAANLQDRVHFLGWRPDARTLYGAFDLFLMPSLWEGFGLVLLEAMAAGIPIVASNVSAIPEIVVDEQTGFLVPPGNSTTLAARLLTIFNDPAMSGAMGSAGRERLDRIFSVQHMVEATRKIYEIE